MYIILKWRPIFSIEIHSVLPDRRIVKNVRSQLQQIAWYSFCPRSSIIVISPSITTSILQVFFIKTGYVYKLPKIECENASIRDKDVTICNLYDGQNIVAVFLHDQTSGAASVTEVHLFPISKDNSTTSRSHVLQVSRELCL